MYKYSDTDKKIIASRVKQFQNQVNRRLEGKLTEEEFKPLRLMNGLYLQLHAYMLRVAIPYGELHLNNLGRLLLLQINMTEDTVILQLDKIFSLIGRSYQISQKYFVNSR